GGLTPDDNSNSSEQAAVPPDDGTQPDNAQNPYDVTAVQPSPPYGASSAPDTRPPYARSPRDPLYSGPSEEKDPYGAPLPPEPYGGPPPPAAYGGPPPPSQYGEAPQGPYGDAPPGPYGQGNPYGQNYAAAPPQGAPGQPGAQQPAAQQPGAPQEEWVVVLVS